MPVLERSPRSETQPPPADIPKQEALRGATPSVEGIEPRMQQIAAEAAAIAQTAQEKEMDEVARQAEVLRQQILAAKNKIALLSPKARA